jgi:tetratricopeptide (TPR) repeat protein
MSERDADDLQKKYGPALDAALGKAGDRIEEIHREIEAAAGLLEELTAMPEEKRSERIRTEVRFHALKLCDLLLKRSREAWFRDPARAVGLARLAVEIAEWLDVGHYGEVLVEEERALAWAYLGNAHRIASDLRSAEEALLRAEAHYKRGGEDALTGAQILSFVASLRISQGRFGEAAELIDRAIAVYREARDRHLEGKALIKKGTVLGYEGRYPEAVRIVRRGLSRINLLEEPRLLVAAQHNLTWYLNESGRHQEALDNLQTTRAVYIELGDEAHLIRLRWLEGRICRDLVRLDQAETALREARPTICRRPFGAFWVRVGGVPGARAPGFSGVPSPTRTALPFTGVLARLLRGVALHALLGPSQLSVQRASLLLEEHDLLLRGQTLESRIMRFPDTAHHFNCFNLRFVHELIS